MANLFLVCDKIRNAIQVDVSIYCKCATYITDRDVSDFRIFLSSLLFQRLTHLFVRFLSCFLLLLYLLHCFLESLCVPFSLFVKYIHELFLVLLILYQSKFLLVFIK